MTNLISTTKEKGLVRTKRGIGDRIIPVILFLCTMVSIVTTVGIVLTLLVEAVRFFREVSILDFFTGTEWTPLFAGESQKFGVLPLIVGTLWITFFASLVALPLGLFSAIYLSEYASVKIRRRIKPILEVLAGVPTIVYGFFALQFVTPIIRQLFPETSIYNAASAGIVVGIMILPMVASISEDAMTAVPRSLRQAAYALGATRYEVAMKVVVPAALSGIIASFILGISRAIGETMIVSIAAGSSPNLTWNPLESIQTMTGYIVQVSTGDVEHGGVKYLTMFAIGFTLFIFTFVMNLIASWVSRRFKEEY